MSYLASYNTLIHRIDLETAADRNQFWKRRLSNATYYLDFLPLWSGRETTALSFVWSFRESAATCPTASHCPMMDLGQESACRVWTASLEIWGDQQQILRIGLE